MKNEEAKLIFVSLYEDYIYVGWLVLVQRGIKGKAKNKVEELLIEGIPNKNINKWCIKNEIFITNKAVYNATTNKRILTRREGTNFYERNKIIK